MHSQITYIPSIGPSVELVLSRSHQKCVQSRLGIPSLSHVLSKLRLMQKRVVGSHFGSYFLANTSCDPVHNTSSNTPMATHPRNNSKCNACPDLASSSRLMPILPLYLSLKLEPDVDFLGAHRCFKKLDTHDSTGRTA